jgi:serine O-acetyltransferase
MLFPNIRADFRANGSKIGAQGFWALVTYRFGRWRYTLRWRPLRMPFSFLYHVLYKVTQILTGIELPCEAEIGRHLAIDHFGGIIVSGYARIGNDCRIRNGVVIGLRHTDQPVAPVLGDRVDVGAGAKILGPITIGDDVHIGANAVVLCDVPANHVAVGVPARCRPRTSKAVAR